jgi:hypothetical protein
MKLAATAAALLGGLALASAAQAFTVLDLASNGQLYDFNSTSGAITAVGSESIVMEGLGQLGSTVYGESADQLYSISSAGVETAIGSAVAGVTFVDFGSTTSGLFAISTTGNLYTINDSTGAATLDGSLGLGTFASHLTTIGMSTGSGTLYFDDGLTMYSLNTATGVATNIGTISGGPTNYGALAYLSAAQTGTTAGLYGGSNKDGLHGASLHSALVSFNSSFAGTLVAETTPNDTSHTAFWGFAPGFGATVLPEPSEWALMLAGVGAVGGALRARRRKATAAA